MATVNFAANGFATTSVVYYLHSEHYETLLGKEKEQSLVKMRSCKVRKRQKLCSVRLSIFKDYRR